MARGRVEIEHPWAGALAVSFVGIIVVDTDALQRRDFILRREFPSERGHRIVAAVWDTAEDGVGPPIRELVVQWFLCAGASLGSLEVASDRG